MRFRLWGGLGLAGCAPSPTWHADVAPIVEGRCVNCHASGGIAPFPLETYDQAYAIREAVAASVASGAMPPWPAGPGDVAFARDPSLTAEQIATITAWVDAGAPEGNPADRGEALPSVASSLSRVDRTLTMPVPYAPTAVPDEYRCFILDCRRRR